MRCSVVVPLFNKVDSVLRTISSIRAQTFADIEILVVDDGSTDGSAELVESISDARISLIRQTNAGPGAARNRGIAEAKGELIAFLDADDEWLPEYLAHQVSQLEAAAPDVAATVCGYFEFPANVSREPTWRARGLTDGITRVSPEMGISEVLALLAYMSPCTTVFRTRVIGELGGFFEHGCRYGEDAFMLLKLLMRFGVAVTLRSYVLYHKEDSNLSANLRGPRPIEPFLVDPEKVMSSCPPLLENLFWSIIGARALKTACVYGYWSRSTQARKVMRPLWRHAPFSNRLFLPALIACTPLGDLAGYCVRALYERGGSERNST